MGNNHADEQAAAATAAMNRVLAAEREAEQAVAACERQAQALLQAAYARARRIATRADERLSLLRMHCNDHISRQIEVMERTDEQVAQQESSQKPQEAARIAVIVEQLAAELSAGDSTSIPVKDGNR
jgi:hypothetical protein